MATFPLPLVSPNPTSWGPPPSQQSTTRFASLPYAPFGRSDRIGRVADFTTVAFVRTGDATSGYRHNYTAKSSSLRGNVNAEFQYRVDSTAKEFQLVDSSKLGGKRFAPQANKRRRLE